MMLRSFPMDWQSCPLVIGSCKCLKELKETLVFSLLLFASRPAGRLVFVHNWPFFLSLPSLSFYLSPGGLVIFTNNCGKCLEKKEPDNDKCHVFAGQADAFCRTSAFMQ